MSVRTLFQANPPATRPGRWGAPALVAALAALAGALAFWTLAEQVSPARWWGVASHPDLADPAALLFVQSSLPRLAMAVLCGAGLAVAGGLSQAVLGNVLAVPGTLGVSAGAQLGVLVAALLVPTSWFVTQETGALLGGLLVTAVVMAVAAARRFSPSATVLAGLSVGLFVAALGGLLKLFNHEDVGAAALWAAGALEQDGWGEVRWLLPCLAVLFGAAALLLRPIGLMGLSETGARSLGAAPGLTRALALAVAVAITCTVTACAGLVGLVDLAAPLVVGLAGARRLGERLALSAVAGAALLVVVDMLAQGLEARLGAVVPTGALAAAAAAPLLLALLPRLRGDAMPDVPEALPRARRPRAMLVLLGAAALLAGVGALAVGRTGSGWSWPGDSSVSAVLAWRLPRTGAAFAAGAALAGAGALLQRVTRNALASPESLGLGAAAMAGFAVVLLLRDRPGNLALTLGGAAGALAAMGLLAAGSWRARFAPNRILLLGISLAAALGALLVAALALNDPRAMVLTSLLMGSAAGVSGGAAAALLGSTVALLALALCLTRPLDLLGLGDGLAQGVGLALSAARLAVLGTAVLLTAGAVLLVGPLSFVGLLGPQLALRLGLARPLWQVPGAALAGGTVMIAADWIGRVAIAPFELPAGLVASLVGIPVLVGLLARRAASA